MNRRNVLTGLVAASLSAGATPVFASAPDVAIVGAGIAGLRAAQTLRAAGKSVIVVEAANRIGGRAFTEASSLGQPFDHGCSWINADDNPFLKISKSLGFEVMRHSGAGEALYVDGKLANTDQRASYNKAWGDIERAFERAGTAGKDIAASEIVPDDLEFGATVQTWIGAMDHAVDFQDLSVLDYWEAAESYPSFTVREGLGAVVSQFGADVPVSLDTRVTAIDWSGKGVTVQTDKGAINAKVCIITVSTGVLASERIRFSPELPLETQTAISDLPMGLLCKIGLQFDGARFGFVPNHWLTHHIAEDSPGNGCFFLTWPFAYDHCVGFVGGKFGWALSQAGTDATIDYALEKLVSVAGSDVRKHFVRGVMSSWADNPNTLGAYASARPGRYAARSELEQPVADRLFFAGEAVAGAYAALCSGAYFSGEAQARRAMKVLG